ncbi:MAG TPA: hypothetical protein VEF34_11390 [Syntrophobacteraceae bacterium]|nr:hypothetical protein [Syntrophobacteraceae bacterium]
MLYQLAFDAERDLLGLAVNLAINISVVLPQFKKAVVMESCIYINVP